jgi:hypothetical protein
MAVVPNTTFEGRTIRNSMVSPSPVLQPDAEYQLLTETVTESLVRFAH